MSEVQQTQQMIEDLGEMVKSLLVKMDSVDKRIEMIENQQVGVQELGNLPDPAQMADRQEAVFHTMKRIETLKASQEMLQRQGIQDALDEAANYAIADYKMNPPKHRA